MASLRKKNKLKRIGLIVKQGDPETLRHLEKLVDYIVSHERLSSSVQLLTERHVARLVRAKIRSQTADYIAEHADLVIALGGDGTILRAARRLLQCRRKELPPLLGINAGHLGFLNFVSPYEAEEVLDRLFKNFDSARVEERSCLHVTVVRRKKIYKEFHVLNDCVLSKGSLSRLFEFHIELNSEFLSSYRADGLIASTPTGSTAYNLAAGGSIIEPSIPAIQLTPICPQSLSNKPIVVSDQSLISLRLGRHSSDVFLTFDGQTGLKVESEDDILIRRSPKIIRFLLPPGMTSAHYFHSLRQKLKWGLVSALPK